MFNILDKEQELNKLKMRIINIIAHELEHPLKRMLYCVNILNNYRGNLPDNEDINYCFKEMDNTIYTLLELTENVQIINQGSYEELYVNNSAFDIHYFVSYIIDDFNFSLLKRRDIVFQVKSNLDLIKNTQNEISNKDGQDHRKFMTNKKILSQIIRNILSNAVKFSKRNTVIRVTLINNIKNAEIIIKDNGIGIPKNEMDKIYDLFYKASNALNTEGAGIGLLVVKSALEILGGTIKIESELGKGTTVSCVIPNFEHLII
ncbi:Sensor histidine kinase WalK [bioreactor metagenome]|uniref:histidine kinase n=1 Tax=bioreactor metagenome TaxID=1076179 RepID=A0A645EW39_9ZZZZ